MVGLLQRLLQNQGLIQIRQIQEKKIPVNLEIVDDNEYRVSEDQREHLKYKNFTPREEVDHDTESGAKTQLRKEANDVVMKNERIITTS